MRILTIDDSQERQDSFKLQYQNHILFQATTYDDAISLINSYTFDVISFDHDLSDFKDNVERTGASIARYLAYNGIQCGIAIIHSHNPIGANNIISILKSGEVSKDIRYSPFRLIPEMKGLKEQV